MYRAKRRRPYTYRADYLSLLARRRLLAAQKPLPVPVWAQRLQQALDAAAIAFGEVGRRGLGPLLREEAA